MVQTACENAEKNKKLNNIENYEIICSKVEDVIDKAIEPYKECNIVGVLDPPRAGLHKNVVQALRNCKGLKNLIYVACSPSSVIDNLNFLTLPTICKKKHNKRKGEPFTPVVCYAVDIFP